MNYLRATLALAILAATLAAIQRGLFDSRLELIGTGANDDDVVSRSLFIAPTDLNFGEVVTGGEVGRKLRLVNRGSGPIQVERLFGDCTCLRVSPRQFEVAPGAVQEVTVVWNVASSRQEEGFITTPLRAQLNGGYGQAWAIAVEVHPLFADQRPIRIPLPYDCSPEKPITFDRELTSHVLKLSGDARPDTGDFQLTQSENRVRGLWTKPTAFPPGRTAVTIHLSGVSATGMQVEGTIPIIVEREIPWQVYPTVVNFGQVSGEQVQQVRINFTNPVSECAVETQGESEVTLSESTDVISSTATFRCRVDQPQMGLQRRTLKVRAKFSDGSPEGLISIPVIYRGVAP